MSSWSKAIVHKWEIIIGTSWGLISWFIVVNSAGMAINAFKNPFWVLIILPTYIPYRLGSISFIFSYGTIFPVFPIVFGVIIVYLYRRFSDLIEVKRSNITNR